jgi:hypothetical protein
MSWRLLTASCVLLACGGPATAQDEAQKLIDTAIKAQGGLEKLSKVRAVQLKTKGTLEVMGGLAFTQEISLSPPDRFKEVMHLEAGGKAITIITVFDGKKGWLSVAGETKEVEGKILEELKEGAHLARVMRLVFLKDKSVELSPLGEVKVNDRPAVGVKVACKGHRDVDLFFDKGTGLVAKVVRRGVDLMTDQEITEERVITEYQEVEGQKTPKKAVVSRDGKKFLEVEVLEVKYPAAIDDSEFAKP